VGARYHPGVIWGPFVLALALGLVVSAGLYFAYLWPQVEPDDEAVATAGGGSAAVAQPAATEAETEIPAPSSESSESSESAEPVAKDDAPA
jgi:hypothetical protein